MLVLAAADAGNEIVLGFFHWLFEGLASIGFLSWGLRLVFGVVIVPLAVDLMIIADIAFRPVWDQACLWAAFVGAVGFAMVNVFRKEAETPEGFSALWVLGFEVVLLLVPPLLLDRFARGAEGERLRKNPPSVNSRLFRMTLWYYVLLVPVLAPLALAYLDRWKTRNKLWQVYGYLSVVVVLLAWLRIDTWLPITYGGGAFFVRHSADGIWSFGPYAFWLWPLLAFTPVFWIEFYDRLYEPLMRAFRTRKEAQGFGSPMGGGEPGPQIPGTQQPARPATPDDLPD